MTCLPDFLWSDPRCLTLKKRRRRLWMLLCDMERLRARWHPDDVACWPDGVWAANLDVTDRRLALDLAELRALGVMEPDRIALSPCRLVSDISQTVPRPRYPSDARRARQEDRDFATLPQHALADSADAPHNALAESETTPQPLHTDSAAIPLPVYTRERLSLAKPGLASSANAESQSLASQSVAEPSGRAPLPQNAVIPSQNAVIPSQNGRFHHRPEPNSEEMQALLSRHRRVDIEEAIRRVQRRPNFDGAGNWLLYLTPVLRDIEGETLPTATAAALPAAERDDSVPCVTGNDSANTPHGLRPDSAGTPQPAPHSPPQPPRPKREMPQRETPAFFKPDRAFFESLKSTANR